MSLDEEAVAVWAEKIGSNVTLGQILDYLLNRQKSVMQVYKSTAQTLTTSAAKVTMGNISKNVGDGFELYNGGIRIKEGSGINQVIVSGSIYCNNGLTDKDTVHGQFYRNGTNMATFATVRGYGGIVFLPGLPLMMDVSEGDVIYIYAYNRTGARGNLPNYWQNHLIVQEL